ncbi:MAG TPA: hypothetical protein VN969_05735 [Streptosporangiaceae bacterium]|nr:hypothetical protein [Streptosporangiaceae bacterium]
MVTGRVLAALAIEVVASQERLPPAMTYSRCAMPGCGETARYPVSLVLG